MCKTKGSSKFNEILWSKHNFNLIKTPVPHILHTSDNIQTTTAQCSIHMHTQDRMFADIKNKATGNKCWTEVTNAGYYNIKLCNMGDILLNNSTWSTQHQLA